MTVTVDCESVCTKKQFLTEMKTVFDEMFGLNYDAFIDGARGIEHPLTITVLNINCYEDAQNLKEIFQIIEQENPLVRFAVK